MSKVSFIVTFELPDTATTDDAGNYVIDAMRSWRGQYFPGDEKDDAHPMWDLDPDTVRVFRTLEI
jgi:hypothetical protein